MSRSTWIAVIAAVALVGLAAARSRAPARRGITTLSFAQLRPDEIDRVEITGRNPVLLERVGDAWTADGKEADPNAVKGLLGALPRIVSSDLVTASPARHAELQVDDASGVHVKALAGSRVVAELIAGRADSGGVHVRNGAEVYLVPGVYPGTFSRDKKGWTDRRLFKDPVSDVTRVEIARAGRAAWALVKQDDGAWALADGAALPRGFRFDAAAARSLVSQLAGAQAADFPDGEGEGLGGDHADRFVLTVGTSGTLTRELVLGATREDGSVWARASTRGYPVAVAAATAAALRKEPSDLRDLALMKVDRAKVRKIAVHDGKERYALVKGTDGWTLESHSAKLPAGFELDPLAGERKLTAVLGARGRRLAPRGASFVANGAKVTLSLEGGTTATLAFGASSPADGEELVQARGNADGEIYLVPASLAKSLLAGAEALARPAAGAAQGGFDPAALQNLPPEIREAFLRQEAQRAQQERALEALRQRAGAVQ